MKGFSFFPICMSCHIESPELGARTPGEGLPDSSLADSHQDAEIGRRLVGAKDAPSQAFVVPSSAPCSLEESVPHSSSECLLYAGSQPGKGGLTVSWGNPLAGGQVAGAKRSGRPCCWGEWRGRLLFVGFNLKTQRPKEIRIL